MYYKRDDFNIDIVNFPFLDCDVPRCHSYGEYISQLIHFARESSHVTDSNNRNKFLTAKLLKQGFRYKKNSAKHFLNFSKGSPSVMQRIVSVESSFLLLHSYLT